MNSKKAILLIVLTILVLGAIIYGLHVYQIKTDEDFDVLIRDANTQLIDHSSSGSSTSSALDDEDGAISLGVASSTPKKSDFKDVKINSSALKANSPKTFIVAFFGDQGVANPAHRVLELVKKENADAAVLLGDYDYVDDPKAWMTLIEGELGNDFPIIPVIGNHDEKKWKEYSVLLTEHLKRTPQVLCEGELAVKAQCTFKRLRVFVVAPGINSIPVSSDLYSDFINSASLKLKNTYATLSAADANPLDTYWNVCAWHKNQRSMQVGGKADETGWDTYNTCLNLGFPIITAHEHSYSRSFLMKNLQRQELAEKKTVSLASSSAISSPLNIDDLRIMPGQTFVTVSGLGGHSIRAQYLNNSWWSTVYTSNQGAKPGALFCAFNYQGDNGQTLCYFKNIDEEVVDAFMIKK